MVVIDTDIFVLAFAFHRDDRHEVNNQFLQSVHTHEPAITIFSVMELLGQLSFNLSAERLNQWSIWLQNSYGLSVLYPETVGLTADAFFPALFIDQLLRRMTQHPTPYLDSIILNIIEATENVHSFVTWNARHYRGHTSLQVLTPAEFLETPAT